MALREKLLCIGLDILFREDGSGLVLPAGITEASRQCSQHEIKLMSILLKLACKPEGNEVAQVETISRWVDAEFHTQWVFSLLDPLPCIIRQHRQISKETSRS